MFLKFESIAAFVALLTGLLSLPVAAATANSDEDLPDNLASSLSIGALSQYVSQGREFLTDGPFYTINATVNTGSIGYSAWVAIGPQDDYQELDLTLSWTQDFGSLNVWAAYNYLKFPGFDQDDHELYLTLTQGLPGNLAFDVGAIYSKEADGFFVESGLTWQYDIPHTPLNISPTVRYGLDYSYISPSHDGPNHWMAGLTLNWVLNEQFTVSGLWQRVWALEDAERSRQDDFSWGGIGVTLNF